MPASRGSEIGFLKREFGCFAQSGDEMDGQRTGPQTAFLAASMEQRRQRDCFLASFPGNESADSFWSINLVSAYTNQVDSLISKGNEVLAEPLGSVDVEVRRVRFERF